MPVIHFHGTEDEFAPSREARGRESLYGTDYQSADHSVQARVKANGCDEEPITDVLSEPTNGTSDSLIP